MTTNKEFRELLNQKWPASDPGRHKNFRFEQRKRGYGDYLWFQDRDMYNDIKRRHDNGTEVIK